MSPRYFAKFTGSPLENANQWFHFSSSNYQPGSPEFKIHKSKSKILFFICKILRIK
jgi:hypothetical protein